MEHIRSNLFWNFGEHLHGERGFCVDGIPGEVAAIAKCKKRFREQFLTRNGEKLTSNKKKLSDFNLELQIDLILMQFNRKKHVLIEIFLY